MIKTASHYPGFIMARTPKLPRQRTAFAEWLIKERAARGWSQTALAETAGVSSAAISKIEAGGKFSRDMVIRLAKALTPRDSDERTADFLLNSGLRAAFPRPEDNDEVSGIAVEPLTHQQKLKLWESMGARTYYGPEPDDDDFELSENPDEWPPDLREALQEALFFTRLIPPEFVKTVFQLWRDQARAHAGVAVNSKVMETAIKSSKPKNDRKND